MMLQDIAPKTFHIEYRNDRPEKQDVLLCFRKNEILLGVLEDGTLIFPEVGDMTNSLQTEQTDHGECRYLFAVDQTKYYLYTGEAMPVFGSFRYHSVRDLRHFKPMWQAFAAANGYRLWCWYQSRKFCGSCGSKLIHSEKERAMCCPSCGSVEYPVICPSVIVAVRNRDRLLLTRYQASHSPYRNYALVAGYVETGETAEDTVRREVMEEVGLKVKNITYYKSQPWPFSGAFLMGFFCDVDGEDTISLEEEELSEAVWMKRRDLPDRSGDVSLTSEMMEQFRLGLA